ncbi:hypothetical protein [Hyphobacterium sp.]|uniref:hypothetical protein n=1 Tax=Hyphobacterium sp. TaxID=2004662 RepID=UPI003BAAD2C1
MTLCRQARNLCSGDVAGWLAQDDFVEMAQLGPGFRRDDDENIARPIFARQDNRESVLECVGALIPSRLPPAARARTGALPLVAKIAIAVVVWLSIVLLPLILRGRLDKLDELQQLTFWRNLAAGGLWIVAFVPAMAVFAFLAGGDAIRGMVALAFIAPAMMLSFVIGITMLAEGVQAKAENDAAAR